MKERFGVINQVDRAKYEKHYQVPFGYDYMSFDKKQAIAYCKALKGDPRYPNFIVERIYDTPDTSNNREEIFRGGDFKEGEDEKDN